MIFIDIRKNWDVIVLGRFGFIPYMYNIYIYIYIYIHIYKYIIIYIYIYIYINIYVYIYIYRERESFFCSSNIKVVYQFVF